MVRLGPDIAYPQPNSGYRPGKSIIGFSHTRLAGTGGAGRYGNFRIMPIPGEPRHLQCPPFLTFPATDRNWAKPVGEHASLGEYSCQFAFGIKAELTCSRHVGVHRYTFPPSCAPHLIIDISSVLQAGIAPSGQAPYCEYWEMEACCRHAEVEYINKHEIRGWAEHAGGWGHFKRHRVCFFLRSREPFHVYKIADENNISDGHAGAGRELRMVVRYPRDTRQAHLEVGISFNSVSNAREFVERETGGASFETIRSRLRAAWEPWLGLIDAEGGDDNRRTLLKTSLLRLFTQPVDLRDDGGGGFTDIACLWDSIRNANSLQHLISPEFSAALMNSLLQNADTSGWLPDTHLAGHAGYQQSGCCAEILFSEAARKNVEGVDYGHALQACVKNAETPSTAPSFHGRYLDDYERLGFLSTNVQKSCVSRHIEYTYQDWCIARLAMHLGESGLADRFHAKARRLWNLWNEDNRAFMPRRPDGAWEPGIHPEKTLPDAWNDLYSYESSLAFWSFCGLHDMDGLIKRHGGCQKFVDYLDSFLGRNPVVEKETRMIVPHLYSFAGRPDKTADAVRRSLDKYTNSPDGMPDDEDMGCQSSFFICNAIGIYPIYGQTTYSLVPPLFEKTTLRYGKTGKELKVIRHGEGLHIKKVILNGNQQASTFIKHEDIADGGTLEICLDPSRSL
jgi:predicted alpha-1,2-mannosidase